MAQLWKVRTPGYSRQMQSALSGVGDMDFSEPAGAIKTASREELAGTFIALGVATLPLVYQVVPFGPKQGWMWASVTGAVLGGLTKYLANRLIAQELIESSLP